MKVSNCCGQRPQIIDLDLGVDSQDYGVCAKCLEKCLYIDEWEWQEELQLNYMVYEQARRNTIEDQSSERAI
jgi:hypothetical protein